MAKKCSSCGFANNPDNAHYCAKCGKPTEYRKERRYWNPAKMKFKQQLYPIKYELVELEQTTPDISQITEVNTYTFE